MTENVTKPLLQFPDQCKQWRSFKGCQTVAGSMRSVGIIEAPAKTGPSAKIKLQIRNTPSDIVVQRKPLITYSWPLIILFPQYDTV